MSYPIINFPSKRAFCHVFILFFLLGKLCFVPTAVFSQEAKQIEIISTQTMSFDKRSGVNARKLIGNVCFKHQGALMYCDSAYFYSEQDVIDAFSNVRIVQGDTLFLYGDMLNYNGNEKIARMRKRVKLINRETTLTTEFLDYDIKNSVAFYFNNGNIVNSDNKLNSNTGYYYTRDKLFYFRKNVKIVNPKYTITSDTMKYNTVTRVAYFLGPTDIVADSNFIYCENGWYNTETDISQFNKNAYLSSESRMLKGDSLYYERKTGIGKAFRNIRLIDSVQNIILTGHKAFYREIPESAVITDSAMLMHINEADTLFLHADTLRSQADSANIEKTIEAFRNVRFFRPDIQGQCDTLIYETADSVMYMRSNPVVWHGESQITADFVEMHLENQKLSTVHFNQNSFIVSKEDSTRFNQVKGRKMTGYFVNNELDHILVSGNGQSVYYAKDANILIGANKAICSNMIIYLKSRKISRIVFLEQPDATFYPIHKVPQEEVQLKGYTWHGLERPLKKDDIFVRMKP